MRVTPRGQTVHGVRGQTLVQYETEPRPTRGQPAACSLSVMSDCHSGAGDPQGGFYDADRPTRTGAGDRGPAPPAHEDRAPGAVPGEQSALGAGPCVHDLTLSCSPQPPGPVAKSHQPPAWLPPLWSGRDVPSHTPELAGPSTPQLSVGCCRLEDPDGPPVTHT